MMTDMRIILATVHKASAWRKIKQYKGIETVPAKG